MFYLTSSLTFGHLILKVVIIEDKIDIILKGECFYFLKIIFESTMSRLKNVQMFFFLLEKNYDILRPIS